MYRRGCPGCGAAHSELPCRRRHRSSRSAHLEAGIAVDRSGRIGPETARRGVAAAGADAVVHAAPLAPLAAFSRLTLARRTTARAAVRGFLPTADPSRPVRIAPVRRDQIAGGGQALVLA